MKRAALLLAVMASSSIQDARAEADPPRASSAAVVATAPAAPAARERTALPTSDQASATQGEALRAYQTALAKRKLGADVPLSLQRLRDDLSAIEDKLASGRRDEAISDLVSLVESARFEPFKDSDEGRAAVYWLGDSLGRGAAYQPARGYLSRLLSASPNDLWYRRAVHSLVDFALESDDPDPIAKDLETVSAAAPEEVRGDIDYLMGRIAERARRPDAALAAYAKLSPKSRFWAQATYLSGVIAVERQNYAEGEALFCKVADPKRTPKRAALFGGGDFFRVRDLARLGLGRVAHEQYRFDDARYYYYLVPHDSDHLPEALYETATTRYEAKDYAGARQALDELQRLKAEHVYQDETFILDAYIDLATCHFPAADHKLQAFLRRYEPVRDAARQLANDDRALQKLLAAVQASGDPAAAGLGVSDETARALGALVRVDARYGRSARRLAELRHQQSGLRRSLDELDQAALRLAAPEERRPRASAALGSSDLEQVERIEAQVAELERLLRDAQRATKGRPVAGVEALQAELEGLQIRGRAARAALRPKTPNGPEAGEELPRLLLADRQRASALYAAAEALKVTLESQQFALSKDTLRRLESRLSRLLGRARLGRIETVLGKKRALQVEVEALSQGLLPQTLVDSLDAARYLADDEEYWPFEGEDWADEYVGGEKLE